MEELSVGTGSNLINNGWLKIEEDGSWDVLTSSSLGEEGVESVIATADGLVGGHLAIGLDTVLEAKELPAGVTDLDTGLADVDADSFTHFESFFLFLNLKVREVELVKLIDAVKLIEFLQTILSEARSSG